MKKAVCLYIFISLLADVHAQKEANVWVFEAHAAIDFNYDRFTPFNGTGLTDQYGATASMCDRETGRLLFYTDGRNVWNRNHKKMPNGTGLRGGYATAQAALIVPYPGDDHLYYLFTTKSYNDTIPSWLDLGDTEYTGLYYSVIDMRLDKGLGDVVQKEKNIPLIALSTNKLTAIPHANGKDYWLVTHEWGTDRFAAFPVTEEGVGPPEYFPIGEHHTTPAPWELGGWLSPSPNGKMLACAVWEDAQVLELYDFDNATGTISNLRNLGEYPRLNSVAFSPDNSKLYFSYHDQNDPSIIKGGTVQLDLNAGDTDDIINSATRLYWVHETGVGGNDTVSGGPLQLAPDGRLYTSLTYGYSEIKKRIFFIDKPNLPGWLSEPTGRNFAITANKVAGVGRVNFMQHFFNNLTPVDNFFEEEDCKKIEPKLFPNPTDDLIAIRVEDTKCLFPFRIQIFNSLGQLLKSSEIVSEPIPDIDLSEYASGVYIVRVEMPYTSATFKIIKK